MSIYVYVYARVSSIFVVRPLLRPDVGTAAEVAPAPTESTSAEATTESTSAKIS